MLKERDIVVKNAIIFFDVFILSAAFFFAFFIRQNWHRFYKLDLFPAAGAFTEGPASLNNYLLVFIFIVPLWCVLLYLNGLYRSLRVRTLYEVAWIIIKSILFLLLVFSTFIFLFKMEFVSRLFFVLFVFSGFVLLLFEKIVVFYSMHYVRSRGYNYRRLLFVGTGRRATRFIQKIQKHPEWGFQILGAIDDEPDRKFEKIKDVEIIGSLDDLSQILHERAVDEVIFIVPRSRLNHIEDAVYVCETEGIKATIAVDLFDLRIAHSQPTEIDGSPLVTFKTTVASEGQLFLKRVIDITLSGFGIIILSPVFLIVPFLIKLTSPGPVLFKHNRVGLCGRKFVLYKFRTMYQGAQKQLAKAAPIDKMEESAFKDKKLQYITPLGRILRKFSIDEFPQLFNVFSGHMSLIGPRPCVPDEVNQYKTWQRRRFSMRPGLSCLWQINGRNKIGHEDWMKLDLEYLDNWSHWLDFKILIKTVPVVLFGSGAY